MWYFKLQGETVEVSDMDYQIIDIYTVKPVCNDHLFDKICYMWFIQ